MGYPLLFGAKQLLLLLGPVQSMLFFWHAIFLAWQVAWHEISHKVVHKSKSKWNQWWAPDSDGCELINLNNTKTAQDWPIRLRWISATCDTDDSKRNIVSACERLCHKGIITIDFPVPEEWLRMYMKYFQIVFEYSSILFQPWKAVKVVAPPGFADRERHSNIDKEVKTVFEYFIIEGEVSWHFQLAGA